VLPGVTSSRAGVEAVFSSTGFRIRAAQGQARDHGVASHGLGRFGLAKHRFACLAERVAATLFFTLFPAECRICSSPLIEVSRLPVCKACVTSIQPLQGPCCTVCGEGLHPVPCIECGRTDCEEANHSPKDARCPLCQRTNPSFERAVAYGSYEGELRDLIHLLKFQQVRPAADVLARMLAESIETLAQTIPVGESSSEFTSSRIAVIPVPLHKRKKAQRGFNQAEVIARSALKLLSDPGRFELCAGILVRRRETGSQIGLTRHQRCENIRGAFAVNDPMRILDRDILLVDDVLTTDTTASECARVLIRAGAARVWVVTVARTLKIFGAVTPEQLLAEGNEARLRVAAQG
jgi:ComF family protein